MSLLDRKFLGVLSNLFLSLFTFLITIKLLDIQISWYIVAYIFIFRQSLSFLMFNDFRQSWSKASTKSGLIKLFIFTVSFLIYTPIFNYVYNIPFNFLFIDFVLFSFLSNIIVYLYKYNKNKARNKKTKDLVIYGAGKAGIKLHSELIDSEYETLCFIDDEDILHNRSIDTLLIYSKDKFLKKHQFSKVDRLVIAMPSASKEQITTIYEEMKNHFEDIKILPSLDIILKKENFTKQLKDISVEDLLARHPKDLDKKQIENFIKNKVVLITGAGGSIGSEISRQCKKFGAKQLILLDHSEYNLYKINEELKDENVFSVMQTVRNINYLESTFKKYKPQIVIHAAAYKHVPLVEDNILEGISNNIIGTKNCIDISIKHKVEKFVLISTDKAVRPTNVMGTTKRICELYAQNVLANNTEIVAVRFGNVLGSSGSVIPKFKSQIQQGGPITVTHPNITRYFMLIPEACELVLQAASIGKGGEIFILDMGEPIKIVDLAKKMIDLSGRENIKVEYCGLRPGEKLYEELLINDSDKKTQYESITVASKTKFDINKLNEKIDDLLKKSNKLDVLKEIVPEFNHNKNN